MGRRKQNNNDVGGSQMGIRIGISGFGRIGRLVLRASVDHKDIDVCAINSTYPPEYMVYMMRYDTVHGRWDAELSYTEDSITINGRKMPVISNRDPAQLNWGDFDVEYVVDATGKFKTTEGASGHLVGGAKKVLITAPVKDDTPMFVCGVNTDAYDPAMKIFSNASCTTNCLAPVAKVLNDNFGIVEGLMTTVHSMTNSQFAVDSKSTKDWRLGRAGTCNIIPAATGAAKAVGKVIPALNGKLTGMAMRVPTVDVSVVDLTVKLDKPTSYEEICRVMKDASQGALKGILGYTDEAVVSSDFIHDDRISVFDAKAGLMLNDTFAKVVAWYDNEWGYSNKCLDLVEYAYSVDHPAK